MFGKKIISQPKPGAIGKWGEKQAERLLKSKRYRILGRRVRVGRRDELDLVARADDDTLVFVEVKTRNREDFGRPSDAVDRAKRRTLSRAAVRYIQRLKTPPTFFRFDIVEVVGSMDDSQPETRHVENAFPLDTRYTLPY